MSELLLCATNYLDGGAVRNGAVAQVLAFDKRGRRKPSSDVLDIVIPVGSGVTPVSVPVAPGDYIVDVRLPNGERRSVEVTVKAEPVLAEIDVTHSPREWLSWQHYVGGVPLHPDLRAEGDAQPTSVAWVTGLEAGVPEQGAAADPWRTKILPVVLGEVPPPPGRALGQAHRESGWTQYRVGGGGDLEPWAQHDPVGGTYEPRRYLLVQTSASHWLVPAPVPWRTLEGTAAVDLLVRDAPVAQVAVSPVDPEIGPVLAYLMGGAAQDARLLVDRGEAKDLLFGKMMNPLAAAAGGYALLATEATGDTAWHRWIHNLAEWFDWLPDGAVQQGRLLLRHRRGPDDVHRARDAFVRAYARGLPFYTLGLIWLVDGLALFAGSGDAEAREMLAPVQEASWRVDLAQPFTTLRLGDA